MVVRVVRFYISYHSVVNLYDSDNMYSENIITHILVSAPLTDSLGSGEHLHISLFLYPPLLGHMRPGSQSLHVRIT